MTDYPLACEIRQRLNSTKPALKPFVSSGKQPEATEEIVKRLPKPTRKKGRINFDGSQEL
jgi:hypothetical protein